MMPETITWGHVLMAIGLLAGLHGLWQGLIWARNRGHGYGTPLYARARDGRRYAIWSTAAGALLFVLGCFTPLSWTPIA